MAEPQAVSKPQDDEQRAAEAKAALDGTQNSVGVMKPVEETAETKPSSTAGGETPKIEDTPEQIAAKEKAQRAMEKIGLGEFMKDGKLDFGAGGMGFGPVLALMAGMVSAFTGQEFDFKKMMAEVSDLTGQKPATANPTDAKTEAAPATKPEHEPQEQAGRKVETAAPEAPATKSAVEVSADLKDMSMQELLERSSLLTQDQVKDMPMVSAATFNTKAIYGNMFDEIEAGAQNKTIQYDPNSNKLLVSDSTMPGAPAKEIKLANETVTAIDLNGKEIASSEVSEQQPLVTLVDNGQVKVDGENVPAAQYLDDMRAKMQQDIMTLRQSPDYQKLEQKYEAAQNQTAPAKPEEPVNADVKVSAVEADKGYAQGVNGTAYTAVVSKPPEGEMKVDVGTGTSNVSLSGLYNTNAQQPEPENVHLVDAKVEQTPEPVVPESAIELKTRLFAGMEIR